MPVYRDDLHVLIRKAHKAVEMAAERMDDERKNSDVRIWLIDRHILYELKMKIDDILQKCKDDSRTLSVKQE